MKHFLTAVSLSVFSLTCLASNNTAVNQCSQLETGFSPEGGAEELVIKTISAAQSDIKMMAYLLSSYTVVRALVSASRHRRVEVEAIVDESNAREKVGRQALLILAQAGVHVRTINVYNIAHDKVIIVDGKHVEFGSFNYTKPAATINSENANTCWNNPAFAALYTEHWQSRWEQGNDFPFHR